MARFDPKTGERLDVAAEKPAAASEPEKTTQGPADKPGQKKKD